MKQIEEAFDTLSCGSSAMPIHIHVCMYVLLSYAILMKLREILTADYCQQGCQIRTDLSCAFNFSFFEFLSACNEPQPT